MIRLNPDPTFDVLVKLTVPGQLAPVEVPMVFRHMASDKLSGWFESNRDKKPADALDEIVAGWSGVMGDDGTMVAYSKNALALLLKNYQPATAEILRAWQLGLSESRVKN